jgi:hypothetical protein
MGAMAIASPRRRGARLLVHDAIRLRAPGGRSLLDFAIVAWLTWGFDAINDLAPVRQNLAERHARAVLRLEHSLHLAPEHALNTWLARHHELTDVVGFWYENIHAGVTFVVIGLLWWRRPALLRSLRIALVAVNLVALAIFWSYPVAPPRMLVHDGYFDLIAVFDHMTPWHAGAVSLHSNQLSSFPSLHIGWAVWSSIAMWRAFPRRGVRIAAVIYPFITLFAVMATGNHYLLDGVVGALITAVCVPLCDRAVVWWDRRRGRPGTAAPT